MVNYIIKLSKESDLKEILENKLNISDTIAE